VITRFDAENYGCIRKGGLDLTPLHALIGPNDSGKSTVLRAMRTLLNLEAAGIDGSATALQARRHASPAETPEFAGLPDTVKYAREGGFTVSSAAQPEVNERTALQADRPLFGPARIIRFDADALKQLSVLLPDEQVAEFPHERGGEIAGVYDAIMNRGDDSFARIAADVRKLFPTVANLRLRTVNNTSKQLGIRLTDGTDVPANQMSEGLLYYLAYLALREVSGAKVLLVEEPETGLHPARIREVMAVLRAMSEGGTQVILTTHSPLVINEMQPREVTIVTRTPEEGTRFTPLAETPDFEARSRVYAPGELWLSYADGVVEGELVR
jgi:predicted ATPase